MFSGLLNGFGEFLRSVSFPNGPKFKIFETDGYKGEITNIRPFGRSVLVDVCLTDPQGTTVVIPDMAVSIKPIEALLTFGGKAPEKISDNLKPIFDTFRGVMGMAKLSAKK